MYKCTYKPGIAASSSQLFNEDNFTDKALMKVLRKDKKTRKSLDFSKNAKSRINDIRKHHRSRQILDPGLDGKKGYLMDPFILLRDKICPTSDNFITSVKLPENPFQPKTGTLIYKC